MRFNQKENGDCDLIFFLSPVTDKFTNYESFLKNDTNIHPNGSPQLKPWGQKEFSILDPDFNLITFGQTI